MKYRRDGLVIAICDLLHQNESHVANTVFELADDKRQRGDIYHFWVKIPMQQYEQ